MPHNNQERKVNGEGDTVTQGVLIVATVIGIISLLAFKIWEAPQAGVDVHSARAAAGMNQAKRSVEAAYTHDSKNTVQGDATNFQTLSPEMLEHIQNSVKAVHDKVELEKGKMSGRQEKKMAVKKRAPAPPRRVFSAEELSKFGPGSETLYAVILGKVFDVTSGAQHYAAGNAYSVFTGMDATKSFITGDFNRETASADVSSLSGPEKSQIPEWVSFFEEKYEQVGVMEGLYYNSDGAETDFLRSVLADAADAIKEGEKEMEQFPPCNVERVVGQPGRIWCTDMTTGHKREWVGVPRKFFKAGAHQHRCACVPVDRLDDARLTEYEGCPPLSASCSVP